MDKSGALLRETGLYIETFIKTRSSGEEKLSNFSSVLKVVQTCSALCVGNDLSSQDCLSIYLAAWFQNTGSLIDKENIQQASAAHAGQYFQERGLDADVIEDIKVLIQATYYPQQPLSLKAQILCDAINSWMADATFFQMFTSIKKANNQIDENELQDPGWSTQGIQMLENTIYFTPTARKLFDKPKEKNRLALKENLENLNGIKNTHRNPDDFKNTKTKPDTLLNENSKMERGVETLFRNTSRNQIHLIRLADYKANLVISINSIIISVILSLLIVKLDQNKYLELPTLMLIITNVLTILIAISATRPKMRFVDKKPEHANIEISNLLYYDNFNRIPFDQFYGKIRETMNDKENLYRMLTTDIYHQGVLLNRKYQRINLAYTVFVIGMLLSILTYITSFWIHGI